MAEINPVPKITPVANSPQPPERVGERLPDSRRHRKRPEGDRFELHPEAETNDELETNETGEPVDTPVHIDFQA